MTTTLRPPTSTPSAAPASPSAPASSLPPRGGVAGPSAAVAVAVLLAALSVGPLVAEGGWFGPTVVAVLVVCLVGAGATWLRVPVFLVPIVQAFALFSVLIAKFTTDAPLGFLPSTDSLAALRAVLADGMADVDQFAPPVPLTDGLSAVIALGIGCVTIVVYVLSVDLRMPVAAGAGLVAVYVVPSFVLDDGSPWWTFVCLAAAWMVLLVSDERVGVVSWGRLLRRGDASAARSAWGGLSSAAVRLGVVATLAALIVPVLVPALTDAVLGRWGQAVSGTGPGEGAGGGGVRLDPLASLKRSLVNQPDATVLHYTTSSPTAGSVYLPTVVLEDYADEKWTARGFSPDVATRVADGVVIAPIPRSGPVTHYSVTVDKLADVYLPVPERTQVVDGLTGTWWADDATGTVFAGQNTTTRQNQTYEVDAITAAPDVSALAAANATTAPDPIQQRSLTDGIPDFLIAQAQEVTSGATTNLERAYDLQQWFLSNFTYSLDVPDTQGTSALQSFLTDRKGYCQQFAATFALMARALGIPSRVVVGYTGGTRQPDGTYVVKAKDAHAWPELSFPGIGWVRFEPTPPSGPGSTIGVPSYAQPGAIATATAAPTSTASASPGSSHSGKVGPSEQEFPAGLTPLEAPGAGTSADTWRLRALLLLLVVAVALAAVPAVRRIVRRRRRLSRQASVEDAWAELRDTARDLGVVWPESLTPRQAVAGIVERAHLRGDVAAAATRIGRTTEQARYAPAPPSTEGLAEDLGTVRTALLERADTGTRLRATLFPPSLRAPEE
ncbi:MAG: hypothetical protein GC157_08765 [Frankiales bacterium]|nr:hypothetical protein [Frankiales bacterium]